MQSFFDPGHGFLSSLDETTVAAVALVVCVLAGALFEYHYDADGWGVVGVAVGVAVAFVLAAPPAVADEWHYVLVGLLPILVAVRLYRGRGE